MKYCKMFRKRRSSTLSHVIIYVTKHENVSKHNSEIDLELKI